MTAQQSGDEFGEFLVELRERAKAFVAEREDALRVAQQMAKDLSGAPYKIVKKGDAFQVVNNLGVVKATFPTEDKARNYQKALYANVPGAAKVADKKPWTGTAKKRTAAAEIIDGDDVKPASLASAVDAALDTATQLIMNNDVSALPAWAQQVCSLTIAAGETIDELLEAMDIPDPDEGTPDSDTIKAAMAAMEASLYVQRSKAFAPSKRMDLAKSGKAMPDGSFPIENGDDLKNALMSFGRAGDKGAAKAHIKKRAVDLNMAHKLPETWKK